MFCKAVLKTFYLKLWHSLPFDIIVCMEAMLSVHKNVMLRICVRILKKKNYGPILSLIKSLCCRKR